MIAFTMPLLVRGEGAKDKLDAHHDSIHNAVTGQGREPRISWMLTIIAFTMSLLLFFRARTAFALDTFACDMTNSMSLTSTPVSST